MCRSHVFRRRFPWNLVLLGVFVSHLWGRRKLFFFVILKSRPKSACLHSVLSHRLSPSLTCAEQFPGLSLVFLPHTQIAASFTFCSTTARLFCSYYETKAVFLAMGITVVVCVSVTIFCFQTKVAGDVVRFVCVCCSAACGLSENVSVVSPKERFCLTLQWATEFR